MCSPYLSSTRHPLATSTKTASRVVRRAKMPPEQLVAVQMVTGMGMECTLVEAKELIDRFCDR